VFLDKVISNSDFVEDGLIAVNLQRTTFENCTFSSLVIYKSNFADCAFIDCVFDRVYFIDPVSTEDLLFDRCKFVNCEFIDAAIYEFKIRNCSFIKNIVSN